MKKFLGVFIIIVIIVVIVVASVFFLINNAYHDNFQDIFKIELGSDNFFDQEEIQILQPWVTHKLNQLKMECDLATEAKDNLLKNSHSSSSEEANEKLDSLHSYNTGISVKCGDYEYANKSARYFDFRDLSVESPIPPNWTGEKDNDKK